MGNREKLLIGARQCLIERGWSRTTVRDIAAAAGVNHAAISYHFGSREALLGQALVDAVAELGAEVDRRAAEDASPQERWAALLDSFTTHRALWVAQLEAIAQAEHVPELRERLADAQQHARAGLGGSIPLAVLVGVMVQTLIDPDAAPGASEIARAVG